MIYHEQLKTYLNYNPLIGNFTWLLNPGTKNLIGKIAGSLNEGYICIGLGKQVYYAHRLAYLFMTGMNPEYEIHHKDEDKSNNKWNNLGLYVNLEEAINAKMKWMVKQKENKNVSQD